jgi:hypothetical protein
MQEAQRIVEPKLIIEEAEIHSQRGGKSRLLAHLGQFEKRRAKRRKADRVSKLARRRNRQ